MISAAQLLRTEFPEPRYAVPGLIPEGLTFFAGPPKVGKSWLALNVALAVASGGRALGQIPVDEGDVLYLALEDGQRRLKSRLEKVLESEPGPDRLIFETTWVPIADGAADDLGAWLALNPGCRLIVIDTLARVRSPVSDRTDKYMADYMTAEKLKAVADEYQVPVLVVHHTRKAQADDFLETVSGTHGLAGAADTVLVLKRSRGRADAELHVTGRDIEERALALRFSSDVGTWALLGDAQEWTLSQTRHCILDAIRTHGPMKPKAVSDLLNIERDTVRQAMSRMARDGQLDADNGVYSIPPSTPVTGVTESQIGLLSCDGVTGVTDEHRERS